MRINQVFAPKVEPDWKVSDRGRYVKPVIEASALFRMFANSGPGLYGLPKEADLPIPSAGKTVARP